MLSAKVHALRWQAVTVPAADAGGAGGVAAGGGCPVAEKLGGLLAAFGEVLVPLEEATWEVDGEAVGEVVVPLGEGVVPLGEGVVPLGKVVVPLGGVVMPPGEGVVPIGGVVVPPGEMVVPLGEVAGLLCKEEVIIGEAVVADKMPPGDMSVPLGVGIPLGGEGVPLGAGKPVGGVVVPFREVGVPVKEVVVWPRGEVVAEGEVAWLPCKVPEKAGEGVEPLGEGVKPLGEVVVPLGEGDRPPGEGSGLSGERTEPVGKAVVLL